MDMHFDGRASLGLRGVFRPSVTLHHCHPPVRRVAAIETRSLRRTGGSAFSGNHEKQIPRAEEHGVLLGSIACGPGDDSLMARTLNAGLNGLLHPEDH